MTRTLFTLFLFSSISCISQSIDQLKIRGNYTATDSAQIVEAYLQAQKAVEFMYQDMLSIRDRSITSSGVYSKEERWNNNQIFQKWLGSSENMRMSFRRIKKIHAKFERRITLFVTKKNRGRCTGWISAWTLPYGAIQIRLCEDFFMYRTHLQEKVLVHEMGHETGLLSHHKIHGCRAALRAASNNAHLAKRSTENYAWLAMSYLDITCAFR